MSNTRTLLILFIVLWALILPVVGETLPSFRGDAAAATLPNYQPPVRLALATAWHEEYGKAVIYFMGGAVGFAIASYWWRKLMGQPEKREVTATTTPAPEYVLRREFKELNVRVDGLEQQVRGVELGLEQKSAEILKAGEDRAIALHQRCNKHDALIGEVSGKLDLVVDLVKQNVGGRRS